MQPRLQGCADCKGPQLDPALSPLFRMPEPGTVAEKTLPFTGFGSKAKPE